MSPMPRRTRRLASAALASCIALAACVVALAPAEVSGEPVVFALALQDPDGSVIASPVVLGDVGQKVEVRMMCRSDPRHERMSLVLDPLESSVDGELAYSYELKVAGRVSSAKGTVRLTTGAEQRIEVDGEGSGVTMALYAAPIGHPGVERYLEDRRERLAPPQS